MTKYLLTCASILGLMTNVALAQGVMSEGSSSTETTTVAAPPVPAGSVSVKKTQHTIDADGVERDSTQSYEKTQSVGSGNGMLTGETHVQTSHQMTTITPPGPVTTTTTRTTTSERVE